MTLHHRGPARIGVTAVLAAVALTTAAAPAQAVDRADLSLAPLSFQLARGVKEAKAKPFKFDVHNSGPSAARGVVVTVDVSKLNPKKVGYLVPAGCTTAATGYTCGLPDVAAGTGAEFPVPLYSTGGRGDGGTLTVRVSSATPDGDTADNEVTVDVPVVRPSYDLSAWTQDVHASVVVDGDAVGEERKTPLARGATADLDWLVYNGGSRQAVGLFLTLGLPAGATFAKLPEGCVARPVGGLAVYDCTVPDVVLKPGQVWTAPVRVKVAREAAGSVLTPGVLTAFGLADTAASLTRTAGGQEGRPATEAQRRMFKELDEGDNTSTFDIFVAATTGPTPAPTGSPTPTGSAVPSGTAVPTPGGGDGGGLPVTGVQVGVIGGVGLGVLVLGGVLFLLARRRRVVLVNPDDETSGR
jgi:hypothetical protein